MGQYLSAPITEKETHEGHSDTLSFGFAGMQGWRVSMEDAHILALDFDAHTSLFSVFDGHGGKAVAEFAATHLAEQIKAAPSYKIGNLGAAVGEAYLALDRMMDTPEGEAELADLAAPPNKPSMTLFTEAETQMDSVAAPDGAAHAQEVLEERKEQQLLFPDVHDGGVDDGPTPSSLSSNSAAGGCPPPEDRRLRKLKSSQEFLASHLQRASVINPNDAPHLKRVASGQRSTPREDEDSENAGDAAADLFLLSSNTAPSVPLEEDSEKKSRAEGTGCTALTVLVRDQTVTIANAGDSRAVLSRRGVAVAVTLDHKPILFEEARRVIRAGGFVRDNRINGSLNVSRALGDLDFKRNPDLKPSEQMVVSTPDVERVTLTDGDEFIILACDGIWDVMSNQEAVDFVRRRIKMGHSLSEIAAAACDHCLAPDLTGMCRGADNMSITIVLFRKTARLDGFWNRMWTSTKDIFR